MINAKNAEFLIQQLSVLVVDDNAFMRNMVRGLLIFRRFRQGKKGADVGLVVNHEVTIANLAIVSMAIFPTSLERRAAWRRSMPRRGSEVLRD